MYDTSGNPVAHSEFGIKMGQNDRYRKYSGFGIVHGGDGGSDLSMCYTWIFLVAVVVAWVLLMSLLFCGACIECVYVALMFP